MDRTPGYKYKYYYSKYNKFLKFLIKKLNYKKVNTMMMFKEKLFCIISTILFTFHSHKITMDNV